MLLVARALTTTKPIDVAGGPGLDGQNQSFNAAGGGGGGGGGGRVELRAGTLDGTVKATAVGGTGGSVSGAFLDLGGAPGEQGDLGFFGGAGGGGGGNGVVDVCTPDGEGVVSATPSTIVRSCP